MTNGLSSQNAGTVRVRNFSAGGTNGPSHPRLKDDDTKKGNLQYIASYRWQPYPKRFLHRLAWVVDVSTLSFRGCGWDWGNATLPTRVATKSETKAAFKLSMISTGLSYIALDLIKVVMMKDPYFWGITDSPPPPFLIFLGLFASPVTRVYRLLLVCAGIMAALKTFYGYLCILYLGISLFGRPRTRIAIPIEAPWMYRRLFGPCLTSLLEYGLAGGWAFWWHQIFRFGFVSPSNWIFVQLPQFLQTKSVFFVLRLTIAFVLSGTMHACGSYTQIAMTYPISEIFLFFILQIPGILIQRVLAHLVSKAGFKCPMWLKRLGNIAFAFVWMLLTGPLAANDFSRGGAWLFEPVPISPLRGLGFGALNEGWLCWHQRWFRRWEGEKWWQQGIQIV
ncbi:hypothetical protein LOZ53_003323 [Ophidiomyces ophidiicola]|uniref:Uncharacterized protein n=1 Tax=Ophidiomyces ophidiicola TaxID=1387563 RepID=A0ACB8UYC3_9EURO|nr:uncharacterized protein LOZ57_004974 [Ophidiomyces ophidiicola]KAI1909076.1 hypothetical protein LOZ61_005218 [Ophidiomyces ophidiicola]KAI1918678.1 hypothetical protein LOZ64_002652 [Ophidiomyces ophidiicola]KAI1944297.1 hypothetical protein LOZ57_004974 [Ophidiomyces ophidiicola]KAI1957288.1 hypothetical protein LOZ59_003955 [Ophidiomyces ophidiicola]KAI1972503.1 hypothetical protein LOZ56_002398 [Ophidiomyces ophidiicola]